MVALLGTNGAGKSTLLNAISGVVQASRGAVIFDGRDITHAPPEEIAALGHRPGAGRQGHLPEPHGGREPAQRRVDGPPRPGGTGGAAGPGRGDVPGAGRAARRPRRRPLRRPAADAGPVHGLPHPAPAAGDRRAVAGLGPGGGRGAARRGASPPRRGHHHPPGRAVGERGPLGRRSGLLPGEGRGALRRADGRAARSPRRAAVGVPRGRQQGPRRRRRDGVDQRPRAVPTGEVAGVTRRHRRPTRPRRLEQRRGPRAAGRRRALRPPARLRRSTGGDGGADRLGPLGALRRGRGGRRRLAHRGAGRGGRHHRPQRRRQDHPVRPALGAHPGRCRHRRPRRGRPHLPLRVGPGPGRAGSVVPGLPPVPVAHRRGGAGRRPRAVGAGARPDQRRPPHCLPSATARPRSPPRSTS